MDIFAFRSEGTLSARVLDLLDGAVGVFREPVGGLDYVLESVEAELTALGARAADDERVWERTLRALGERVSAARAEVMRAVDPLLDRRSCDLDSVGKLARRGAHRLGTALAPGAVMRRGAAREGGREDLGEDERAAPVVRPDPLEEGERPAALLRRVGH